MARNKKIIKLKNWIVGIGSTLIFGSHIFLLIKGSLPDDMAEIHSALNIFAGLLVLGGYLITK